MGYLILRKGFYRHAGNMSEGRTQAFTDGSKDPRRGSAFVVQECEVRVRKRNYRSSGCIYGGDDGHTVGLAVGGGS
jgi:hypothetical protein